MQMQSYPFRMTAENLAKHRLDPEHRVLEGAQERLGPFRGDAVRAERDWSAAEHYHFDAVSSHPVSGSAACPDLDTVASVESAVAAKQRQDEAQVAAQVAKGVKPIAFVYEDGGQNPVFKDSVDMLSRPEAVEHGPQEIVLGNDGKPLKVSPVVQVAATQAKPAAAPATFTVASGNPTLIKPADVAAAAQSPSNSGFNLSGITNSSKSLMSGLIGGVSGAPQMQVYEPAQPIPTDAPLPPKRSAEVDKALKMATAKAEDQPQ